MKALQVVFHYHIEDGDGNIMMTNDGFDQDEYVLGSGGLLKAFEQVLESMEVGATSEFVLSPEEGYGASNPELLFEFPLGLFGFTGDMEIGELIQLPNGMEAVVVSKGESHLVADANSPMTGKELHCRFQLLERNEVETAHEGGACGPGCAC